LSWTIGTFSKALNTSFKSSTGNLWFTSLSINCFISPLHLSISYGRYRTPILASFLIISPSSKPGMFINGLWSSHYP
jgi:hypothetical protein